MLSWGFSEEISIGIDDFPINIQQMDNWMVNKKSSSLGKVNADTHCIWKPTLHEAIYMFCRFAEL